MDELIRELAKTIGITADAIVAHYVHWYIWASITWILLAVVAVIAAWRADYAWADEPEAARFWVRLIVGAIGLVVVGCNLPDLLSPTGIAIHQLLTDVRG